MCASSEGGGKLSQRGSGPSLAPVHQDVAGGVPSQQVVHKGDCDRGAGGRGGERQPREALGEGGGRVRGHQAGRQEDIHQLEEPHAVLRLRQGTGTET